MNTKIQRWQGLAEHGERVMKFGMAVTMKATSAQVTRAGVIRFVATMIK